MKFVNIVIPMAGRGSRFSDAGYVDPKPLINVKNKAMIELVAENLRPKNTIVDLFLFVRKKY